jgi:polar amino acid transport system permease protein
VVAEQQLIYLLEGVLLTLSLSLISFLVGILVGIPLAFIRVYEKEISFAVDWYEKVFRGIPEIVLMLLLYLGLGPYFSIFSNPFLVACIVLGLRSGANQSQIFRGAIRGVGDEQLIAGVSVGLSKWRAIWEIMVPQVFTFSTPGLASEYALLVKDSSYVFVLALLDLTRRADVLRINTNDYITWYVLAALIYVALTFPLAFYLDRWGNKRKKKIGL